MSQNHTLQKSSSTQSNYLNEYGCQQKLVCYANIKKNLSPTAELSLAKDYNTKVNQYNKEAKPQTSYKSNYDEKTKTNLKENLERINSLYKNNPTLKQSDPITQSTLPLFQERNHIKKTPLSDLDNFKLVNNNPLSAKQNPNSKVNYETSQDDWKSSQRTIQPAPASSRDLFQKRELKTAEQNPAKRNPITNELEQQRFQKHQSYGVINNVESKKLLANEYGQELRYKEDRGMAAKVNSYQSQERSYSYQAVNQGDFRKKQSEFQNPNTFLRGK